MSLGKKVMPEIGIRKCLEKRVFINWEILTYLNQVPQEILMKSFLQLI